jgi:Flp pilus assembly protein TadG
VTGQPASEARRAERGQALVMFILMSLVMVGAVAIVTDISWVWYGQQRMQRAADAAALAGAVYLPGDPTTAYSTARAEATKNGFTDGSGGVVVTPV